MTQLVDALDIMGERGEEQVPLAEPGGYPLWLTQFSFRFGRISLRSGLISRASFAVKGFSEPQRAQGNSRDREENKANTTTAADSIMLSPQNDNSHDCLPKWRKCMRVCARLFC